jgi:sugar phosphate isomerase/epimerase
MHGLRTTRRGLFKVATASIAAAAVPALAVQQSTGRKSIRLGAPVFNAPADPDELALAHRQLGYRAAYCPSIPLTDAERIRDTEQAFARHDVAIAEVGRWVNLMDADAGRREANLKTVTEGLALADAVNARCCVDIAGSLNPDVWYGPDARNVSCEFFDAAVENARKIIDAVQPKRARFAYEMMGWALPDSADTCLQMLKAVDRQAFAVHLDPCNLVNSPRRFYHNAALINECFDKLGPHIVSCHAKDLRWNVEMNVHFQEVTLGEGQLDYVTYLQRLARLPGDVPLMVEHMKGEKEYNQSREHLFKLAREIGIDWEA